MSIFNNIGIVGCGLIGGSLAKQIRNIYPKTPLWIVDPNPDTQKKVIEDNLCTSVFSQLSDITETPDLVIIATPIQLTSTTINSLVTHLKTSCLFTDTASIKATLFDHLTLHNHRFISGHPMAGTEHQGYQASKADLFKGTTYLLEKGTSEDHRNLTLFIESLEINPHHINIKDHDKLLAAASHFPYLMASLTTKTTTDIIPAEILKPIIGPGYKDTTRVSGSPSTWGASVTSLNKTNLQALLKHLKTNIQELEKIIENPEENLNDYFSKIASIKNNQLKQP